MQVMAGGLIRFGSTRDWRLAPSGAGMPFDSTADSLTFASKTEAEAFAKHLADVTGEDGAPLPWSATDFRPAFDSWRSDRGEPLGLALARLRVEFDRSRGREPIYAAARTYQPYEDQGASRGEAPHGHVWPDEIPANGWVHVPAHANTPSRDVLVTSLTLLPRGEVELTMDGGQKVAVPRNTALAVAEQTEAVDTSGRSIGRRVESTLLRPGQWIQIDANAGVQHTRRERELPEMEYGQTYQLRGRIRELTTTPEGQLQAHMEGVTALSGDTWGNHTPDRKRPYGEMDPVIWPLGQRTVQITTDHAAFDAMLDRPLTIYEIEHANKARQPSTPDVILMARVVHQAAFLIAATDTAYPQHDRLQPLTTALPALLAKIDQAIETADFALLLRTTRSIYDLVDETVGSIDVYMPPGLEPLFAASSHLRSLLLHQHSDQADRALAEIRQQWTEPSPLREMSDEQLFDTVEEWEARAPREQWAREEENWPETPDAITNAATIVVVHDDRPGTRSRVQGLARYDLAAAIVLRDASFRPITGSSGVNWDTDARIEPDTRRARAEQALTGLRGLGRKVELRTAQQSSETSPQTTPATAPREATPTDSSTEPPGPEPETQQSEASAESNSVDEDAFNAVTVTVVHRGHPLESMVRGVAPGDARAEEVLRAAGFRKIRGSDGRGWEPRARKWETRRSAALGAVRGLTALGRNVSSDIEDGTPSGGNFRAQEHRVQEGPFATREEHRASEDQLLKKLHSWIMYMEGHSPSTRSVHYLQEQVAVEAAKVTIVQALQVQQRTYESNGQPDRHLTDEETYEALLGHLTTLDHDNYRRPQEIADRRQEVVSEIRRHLDQCWQTQGTTTYAAFLASDAPPPRVLAADLLPDRKLKYGNHIWTGPAAVLYFSREAHFYGKPVRQLAPGEWRVSVDHDDARLFKTPTEAEEQALSRSIRQSVDALTDFPALDSESFQQSLSELRQSIETWRQSASAGVDRGSDLRYPREDLDKNLDHVFWLLDNRRPLRLLNETLQASTEAAVRVEAALEHSYEDPADQEALRAVAHHCRILRERLETTSRTPKELPTERRFTSIDEVRTHWRNTPDPANAPLHADNARRAADDLDDTDQLTQRGHLIVSRQDSRGHFVITHTGSSLTVATASTRHADRALALAQALEDIAIGQQPFDWTSPGIDQRIAAHQDLIKTVTALQEKTWYPASESAGQRRTLRDVVEAWPRSWINPDDTFELTAGGLVIGADRGFNPAWHILPAASALDLGLPPTPDHDQAHALAQHLESEILDHTGAPSTGTAPLSPCTSPPSGPATV